MASKFVAQRNACTFSADDTAKAVNSPKAAHAIAPLDATNTFGSFGRMVRFGLARVVGLIGPRYEGLKRPS